MKCTYIGNFNEKHEKLKKRCLNGCAISKALTAIIDKKMACETFRETEANRLIKLGKTIFY